MRSPWNRRGYAASAPLPGAKVVLHGYSLEVRRKLRFPGQQGTGGGAQGAVAVDVDRQAVELRRDALVDRGYVAGEEDGDRRLLGAG